MGKENQEIDFSILLASSIHDMKNSLALLLGSLSEISLQCGPKSCASHPDLLKIQDQGQRVNQNLIQLLALYRINQNQYCLNVNEQYMGDFLAEIVSANQPVLESSGISISVQCEDSLSGYFDVELMRGVINTIINNAHQYTKDKIILSACNDEGYLAITVEDNGPGYPLSMLAAEATDNTDVNPLSFSTSSTGLGLYFSNRVAEIHKNSDKHGYTKKGKNELTGGGKFTIYLP